MRLLSLALALSLVPVLSPRAEAAAGCGTIQRLGRLNEIAGALLSDPDPRHMVALRRGLAEAARFDVAAEGDPATRAVTEGHLEFLAALSRGVPAARSGAQTRLAEMAQVLEDRGGPLDCAPPRSSSAAAEPGSDAGEGGGDGSGDGTGRKKKRTASQTAGLTLMGMGAMSIPVIVAPALFGLIRRRQARSDPRYPVRYETRIRFGAEEVPCMVIDLSRHGARIAATQRLPRRKAGSIVLGERTAAVIVRWRQDRLAGLAFETPLAEETIDDLREW